jgi:hypothetical protein
MSIPEARLKLELADRAVDQMLEATSFEAFGAAVRAFLGAARNVRTLVCHVARVLERDADRIDCRRFESWLAQATRSIDPPLPLGELHLPRELELAYAPRPALAMPKRALVIGQSRRAERRRPGSAAFAIAAVYFAHDSRRPAFELCSDYLLRLSTFVEDAANQASVLEDA